MNIWDQGVINNLDSRIWLELADFVSLSLVDSMQIICQSVPYETINLERTHIHDDTCRIVLFPLFKELALL